MKRAVVHAGIGFLAVVASGCALEPEEVGAASEYLVPAAPTLVSPSGTLPLGSAPSYVWNAVAGADSYQVWVVAGGMNPAINATITAASVGCAAGPPAVCTYSPGTVLGAGYGNWTVRGISTMDGPGPFRVPPLYFKLTNQPTASPIAPVGQILDDTPDYTWAPATGATSYRVYVSSGGVAGVIDQTITPAAAGCPGNVGTCTFTSGTSLSTGSGSWTVQTQPGGSWSSLLTFSYNTSLLTTLVSPLNVSVPTSTPTYTWTRVPNAISYRLFVRDSVSSALIDTTLTPTQAGCPGSETNCSFTPTTAVSPGAVQWYVSTNGGAFVGPGRFTFGQDLGPAVLVSPAGTIMDTTPTFTWNAVAGATLYILHVFDSTTPGTTALYTVNVTPAAGGCSSGMGTCSTTPATVLALGNGKWTIQTNTGGLFSPYTNFTLVGNCPMGCDDGNACTVDTCGAMGCVYTNDFGATCDDTNPCTTTDACVAAPSGTAHCRATDSDRAMCAVASPIGPSGPVTTYMPTFSWPDLGTVPTYRFFTERLVAGAHIETFDQVFNAVDICTAGVCSVTPATGIENRETYWGVQTPPHNDGESPQQHGPWSPKQVLTIGLSEAPITSAPTGVIGTNPPTFVWAPVTGTGHEYELWIYTNFTTLVERVTLTEAAVGCSGGMGTCQYTPAMALPAGLGRFTVRANPPDSPGEQGGPYSPYRTYTVP